MLLYIVIRCRHAIEIRTKRDKMMCFSKQQHIFIQLKKNLNARSRPISTSINQFAGQNVAHLQSLQNP